MFLIETYIFVRNCTVFHHNIQINFEKVLILTENVILSSVVFNKINLSTLEMFRFRRKLQFSTKNDRKFVILIVTFSWILSIVFAIAPSLIFIENFQTFFNFWICQFPFSRFDKLFSHYFITRNIFHLMVPGRTSSSVPRAPDHCYKDVV